jgi:hypothetical protein
MSVIVGQGAGFVAAGAAIGSFRGSVMAIRGAAGAVAAAVLTLR